MKNNNTSRNLKRVQFFHQYIFKFVNRKNKREIQIFNTFYEIKHNALKDKLYFRTIK